MLVKICGITNVEDALAAVAAGADLLGFVFYAKSPRHVTPAVARAIGARLPAGIGRVGVFVNEPAEALRRIATEAALTVLQLHGDEPPELLRELADFRRFKALGLQTAADLPRLDAYPEAEFIVVDTPCAERGGSGRPGDWTLARQAAARRPILLAGGLTPSTVAAAVRAVRPAGVDVSSGVERQPGRKDHAKVRAFIPAARAAAAEVAP
jgi:phosphoribosylanthranilate isomerase